MPRFHDLHHHLFDCRGMPSARVRELAASIDRAMAGKPYILLLLLNGALPFAAMLEKHLNAGLR